MPDPRKILGQSEPLVPPLFQSSVYTIRNLDALDRIVDDGEPGFIYARDDHPNAQLLAEQLRVMEQGDWAQICGSGMASITAIILACVQQGDRIVASHRLYGRTTQLLDQELSRFGVTTEFVDCHDFDAVTEALQRGTKMLFVETMSNPMLRVVDLTAMADLAQLHECTFVVDNTFATPLLVRPLEIGTDVVMESLTKMLGGHSDVTLGLLAGKGDWLPILNATVSIWGLAANPFDCWLAERGLATFPLRMQRASENALLLADWLQSQPNVTRVIYPGLVDHPDHAVADRLFNGWYGNMVCFEVDGGRDAVNRFIKKAKQIPFSPSLGNVTTTMSHPATTSHRYVSPAEKRRQGITDGLIRLSVGVEELSDIKKEMAKGLK